MTVGLCGVVGLAYGDITCGAEFTEGKLEAITGLSVGGVSAVWGVIDSEDVDRAEIRDASGGKRNQLGPVQDTPVLFCAPGKEYPDGSSVEGNVADSFVVTCSRGDLRCGSLFETVRVGMGNASNDEFSALLNTGLSDLLPINMSSALVSDIEMLGNSAVAETDIVSRRGEISSDISTGEYDFDISLPPSSLVLHIAETVSGS